MSKKKIILVARIIFITKIPTFPNLRSHSSIKIKHIIFQSKLHYTQTKTILYKKYKLKPKKQNCKKKGMILIQVLKPNNKLILQLQRIVF